MEIVKSLHQLKPVILMVATQVLVALVNVFYKLASRDGMNLRILIAYRYIFASVFLAPLAFFIERKKRPKLTWMVTLLAFLCGLLGGTLGQNLYLLSLTLTSTTFAAATANLVPAITYMIAVIIRMEKLQIHTLAGKAKLMGTAIGIGGAMVLTFYRGPEVIFWSTNIDLTRRFGHGPTASAAAAHHSNIALGAAVGFCSCLSFAIWMIVEALMMERYPCPLSGTALMCFMGAAQNLVLAICLDHNWADWKLGWNIRLWTVAYTGIIASGTVFTLIAWAVKIKGPLYVTSFSPLMLLAVAIVGSLILGEKLHVGSLVGAAGIVIGLYAVLWGKGREIKRISHLTPSRSFKDEESNVATLNSSLLTTLDAKNKHEQDTELSIIAPIRC